MRTKFILIVSGLAFCLHVQRSAAQALYVPSGTGGIGSSSNSNVGIGTTSSPAYSSSSRKWRN